MARSPTEAPTPVQMVNAPPVDVRHDPDEYELTGENTHRATQRGYAIPQTDPPEARAGVLVEEGQLVPAKVPVSDTWMAKVKAADGKLERAAAEASDQSPKDVDLTQVGVPGLRAMAAERGINPKGLSEDQLIAAIKAEREPTI